MAINEFDRIAPFYDALKRLVFGDAIRRSVRHGVQEVSEHARVLVLGGGTGEILDDLFARCPDCEVWYVDPSARMIAKARARCRSASVRFIRGTVDDVPANLLFDIILTPFLLDLFSAESLKRLISALRLRLSAGGLWIVADFIDSEKLRHRVLLKMMYWFFRLVANVEARCLADWRSLMEASGLREVRSAVFYDGFIVSTVYQRSR
jgi:ubiquinone/menaquinone biosynthesis C-methylase UbiE